MRANIEVRAINEVLVCINYWNAMSKPFVFPVLCYEKKF